MKTLGFALAFALTGGAAQAATVFEIPINGGVARIQLDDDCQQAMCASLSWTENDGRGDRKEQHRKEPAKPSTKVKAEPETKLTSSDPDPALGIIRKPSVSSAAPLSPAPAPASTTQAGSGSSREPPAVASRETDTNGPPAGPVPEPNTVASIAPAQPAVSTSKAAEESPVGEWLVEDGTARIRIEDCGKNLCGVVASAKNPNETDRRNPNPELRNRPIIGMPVLLNMKPAKSNLWEGRIYNAKNGQTYTATISLDDPQKLRVEGCVFGGLFCGGQTWTRVN